MPFPSSFHRASIARPPTTAEVRQSLKVPLSSHDRSAPFADNRQIRLHTARTMAREVATTSPIPRLTTRRLVPVSASVTTQACHGAHPTDPAHGVTQRQSYMDGCRRVALILTMPR